MAEVRQIPGMVFVKPETDGDAKQIPGMVFFVEGSPIVLFPVSIISIAGKWTPLVSVAGRWTPNVDRAGKWTPNIDIAGLFKEP